MYQARIEKVKKYLHQQNIDSILITSPTNLTYLSGFVCLSPTEREAYLLITQKSAYILTSPLYAEEVNIKDFSLMLLSAQNPLTTAISQIIKRESLHTLGFEEDDLRFFEYERLAKKDIPLIPLSLHLLREKKSTEEIVAIEHACTLGDKAFNYILPILKPDITEEEIALELELFIRKHHATLSFPSIIAAGPGAAVPHHQTGKRKLQRNEFVLLDFGVKVENYCSDMSRTVFIGSPTDEQKRMYETVRLAQEKAIEYITTCHSGENYAKQNATIESLEKTKRSYQSLRSLQDGNDLKGATIDKIAREYIIEQGYPSFPHSLGHGIGLEVHEAPSLSPYSQDVLKPGMVFSIEPGIYVPGTGGVRIEDLMGIEPSGSRLLTKSPRELIVL